MTSRLDTLLKKFRFSDRWSNQLVPDKYLTCNHTATDKIVEAEKEKLINYIKDVLESVN